MFNDSDVLVDTLSRRYHCYQHISITLCVLQIKTYFNNALLISPCLSISIDIALSVCLSVCLFIRMSGMSSRLLKDIDVVINCYRYATMTGPKGAGSPALSSSGKPIPEKKSSFGALRTFRVLRALKTVAVVPGK